jgi:hypothetical protein
MGEVIVLTPAPTFVRNKSFVASYAKSPVKPSAPAANVLVAPGKPPGSMLLNAHWANELKEATTKAAAKIDEVKILLMIRKFKFLRLVVNGLRGRIGGKDSQQVLRIVASVKITEDVDGGIAKDWSKHKHKFHFSKKQSFLKK